MKPETPPDLAAAFYAEAFKLPRVPAFIDCKPACWLAPFDPLHVPCANDRRWEAFHFLGRQEIRNYPPFAGLDLETLATIEWDPRLGGPGCVEHHRRYDSQADAGPNSDLVIPASVLPNRLRAFLVERGLHDLAKRRFQGYTSSCP